MLKVVIPSEISRPKVIKIDYNAPLDYKFINIIKKMLMEDKDRQYLYGVSNMKVLNDETGELIHQFGKDFEQSPTKNNTNNKEDLSSMQDTTTTSNTSAKEEQDNSNTLTPEEVSFLNDTSEKAKKVFNYLNTSKEELQKIFNEKEALEKEIKRLVISIKTWVEVYEPLIK